MFYEEKTKEKFSMTEIERENSFKEYLKDKGKKGGSLSTYPLAISKFIPDKLNELGEPEYLNLFLCVDIDYLKELKNRLLKNGDLNEFNINLKRV